MPFRTRVWSAGRLLLLVGALAATFGIFFLTAMRIAIHAREVKVPDLRGKPVNEATALLADVGLTLKVELPRKPDPNVAAGGILSQDPDPGSVLRRQRAVRVRVSDGVHTPTVPMVIGESQRTAEIRLAQDQITIGGTAEIHTPAYPAGAVVAIDPPVRTQSGSVTLLINRGDDTATYVMPDLIGTPGDRVTAYLRTRGFRITITGDVSYPGIPSGFVVRQTPQAGYQIMRDQLISLEVSR